MIPQNSVKLEQMLTTFQLFASQWSSIWSTKTKEIQNIDRIATRQGCGSRNHIILGSRSGSAKE
jgi:hypothetical protein